MIYLPVRVLTFSTTYQFFCFVLFFVFLGLHPKHMEFPRLGVKLELLAYTTTIATQDSSHICNLHHLSQQCCVLLIWVFRSFTFNEIIDLVGFNLLSYSLLLYLFISSLLFELFFDFLGPHLWHMKVPRLGVKFELQLPAYATATLNPHVFDLYHSS